MKDVVDKLLTTGSFTKEDFNKLYRLLCKNTHPDLTGKDGKDFIKLQEINKQIQKKTDAEAFFIRQKFDPNKIVIESGYPKPDDERTALFISLQRYVHLGLHSYKLRTKSPLKERNRQVIRTVLYWGNLYDKQFVTIFLEYNKNTLAQIVVDQTLKHGLKGRRVFIDGLRWFNKYQETGRRSAAHIAKDKLLYARYLLKTFTGKNSPILPFLEWLLNELEKPSVVFNPSL